MNPKGKSRDRLHPVTWTPDLDPNGIRREAHESKIRSSLLKLKLYLHPSSFHAFVNFAYLLDVLLNESNMKVGRIDRRRRVVQITESELEPAIVREEGNLPFSTIGATQSEVGLKELRGGADISILEDQCD
jgi:hypothetical protein